MTQAIYLAQQNGRFLAQQNGRLLIVGVIVEPDERQRVLIDGDDNSAHRLAGPESRFVTIAGANDTPGRN